MATPLPYADWIKHPITWAGSKHAVEYRSGSSRISVSLGFNPVTYATTLEYIVDASQAAALLAQLASLSFNNVYTFTCNTVGPVAVQVTGAPSYTEWHTGLKVRVMLPVERIR